jgi:hypothetical protein
MSELQVTVHMLSRQPNLQRPAAMSPFVVPAGQPQSECMSQLLLQTRLGVQLPDAHPLSVTQTAPIAFGRFSSPPPGDPSSSLAQPAATPPSIVNTTNHRPMLIQRPMPCGLLLPPNVPDRARRLPPWAGREHHSATNASALTAPSSEREQRNACSDTSCRDRTQTMPDHSYHTGAVIAQMFGMLLSERESRG